MKVSIRVWRGLKFNPAYAAKMAKKKAREADIIARKAAEEARKNVEKKNRSINPFSVRISTLCQIICPFIRVNDFCLGFRRHIKRSIRFRHAIVRFRPFLSAQGV